MTRGSKALLQSSPSKYESNSTSEIPVVGVNLLSNHLTFSVANVNVTSAAMLCRFGKIEFLCLGEVLGRIIEYANDILSLLNLPMVNAFFLIFVFQSYNALQVVQGDACSHLDGRYATHTRKNSCSISLAVEHKTKDCQQLRFDNEHYIIEHVKQYFPV